MTPAMQAVVNDLVERHPPPGRRLLEVGATVETARGLRPALRGVKYVGLDLEVSDEGRALGIEEGNANAMPQFSDNTFDAVLSTSMLEHDRYFWRTLREVRRVLRPSGRFYVGVPGFSGSISPLARGARGIRNRLNAQGRVGRSLAASKVFTPWVSTLTYPHHMAVDYFRFSPQALNEVLLDGFDVLESRSIWTPPRLIAVGELRGQF